MSNIIKDSNSKLGPIFQISDLRLKTYFEAMANKFASTSEVPGEGNSSRVAHRCCNFFRMLQNGHLRKTDDDQNLATNYVPEHAGRQLLPAAGARENPDQSGTAIPAVPNLTANDAAINPEGVNALPIVWTHFDEYLFTLDNFNTMSGIVDDTTWEGLPAGNF